MSIDHINQFAPLVGLRTYQDAAFRIAMRIVFFLWARQLGKSHLIASKCLERMLKKKYHSCFAASASIMTGRELIEKEATIWHKFLLDLNKAKQKLGVELGGNVYDKKSKDIISWDDLADLLEKAGQIDDVKMFAKAATQIRIYHSRTVYSRTLIIAANPATARGWTGDVFGDEIGFWQKWEEVWDALEPIISSNPEFIFWNFTTPPKDDKHVSYELLNPGIREFTPNAKGNFFKTETGYPVHRVDARDAELAGVHRYDPKEGKIISIEEARAMALDRASFDRNYLLKFIPGGEAAIPQAWLNRAMLLGRGECCALDLAGKEVAA